MDEGKSELETGKGSVPEKGIFGPSQEEVNSVNNAPAKAGGLRRAVETIIKSPLGVAAEVGVAAGAAALGAQVIAKEVHAAPPAIEMVQPEATAVARQTAIAEEGDRIRAASTAVRGATQTAIPAATATRAAYEAEVTKIAAATPVPPGGPGTGPGGVGEKVPTGPEGNEPDPRVAVSLAVGLSTIFTAVLGWLGLRKLRRGGGSGTPPSSIYT